MGWGRAAAALAAMTASTAALDRAFSRFALYGYDSPKYWATVRRRRPGKRKAWRVAAAERGGKR